MAGHPQKAEQEFGQQSADLVAGKRYPGGLVVERFGHCAAESVAVGVGGEDQIGVDFFRPLDNRLENGGVFRIGDVLGNVGKIAVGHSMGGKNLHVGKARCFKHRTDRRSTTPCNGE